MAQNGFTPIQHYRSATPNATPTASNLTFGELALNYADGKLFFKNASNTVQLLASTAAATGTVSSVQASGGSTGLTFTGGPITGSGTLTLGGTLAVGSGGTGATTASAARTNLGATTVGSNLFTLTNPSAIRFLRINADNTVSALSDSDFRTAIGVGTGTGTVTSVNASGGSTGLTFTGGPITNSGTLTLGGTLALANGGTGATTASAARTNLGATTVGANLFTLTNPSAVSFLRINADNTVTARSAADFRSDIGAGTGNGTVTSVQASGGSTGLTFTGGPITSSGTLTLGGTLAVANGGTGATTASAARTNLGATTVGSNLFILADPSAVRFLRINADNSVTARSAADFRSDIGAGTVTSVSGTGSANGLSLSGTVTGSGNITLSGSVTSVASNATIDGVTIGFRNIPRSTTSGTATTGDVGRCIAATAGITIPSGTFAAGDAVSIYNDSASSITITQGSGLTLRLAGTANTGNRTLAQRGVATIWFNSANEAIISGSGLS